MATVISYLVMFFGILTATDKVYGGSCWSRYSAGGYCRGFIKDGISMTNCCKLSLGHAGYTDRNITSSGKLLYYMFINPPPCKPCFQDKPSQKPLHLFFVKKDPCKGIYCGKHRECKLDMFQQPRCVCAPSCDKLPKGSVCGTNSRTYTSQCELLRSRCQEGKDFKVDYFHGCRSSCSKVRCPKEKRCVVDQYKVPHCVTMVCPISCPKSGPQSVICGTDGKTYNSICQLRRTACLSGKAAGMAYRGQCRVTSCSTLKCSGQRKCLTDANKRIRCVACRRFCLEGLYNYRPVCGSNGFTYRNWCMLRKASCDTGRLIDVLHQGGCRAGTNEAGHA